MSDTNTGSGILGNTQAQGAAEATTARQATKVAWQSNTLTHLGIAATLTFVAYLLMNGLEWNFFLKLATGIAVFWAGGKVAGWVGPKLVWHWAGILHTMGVSIIAVALVQSGFYALFSQGVNAIERRAAVAAGITPAVPIPAPTLQRVIWQTGDIYPLQGGQRYLGVLPKEGAIFAQPVLHCVHANAVNGQEATYVPAGTQESNPWGRVLVQPKPSDLGKEFEVWAVRC